jgi:hypothetical protein
MKCNDWLMNGVSTHALIASHRALLSDCRWAMETICQFLGSRYAARYNDQAEYKKALHSNVEFQRAQAWLDAH